MKIDRIKRDKKDFYGFGKTKDMRSEETGCRDLKDKKAEAKKSGEIQNKKGIDTEDRISIHADSKREDPGLDFRVDNLKKTLNDVSHKSSEGHTKKIKDCESKEEDSKKAGQKSRNKLEEEKKRFTGLEDMLKSYLKTESGGGTISSSMGKSIPFLKGIKSAGSIDMTGHAGAEQKLPQGNAGAGQKPQFIGTGGETQKTQGLPRLGEEKTSIPDMGEEKILNKDSLNERDNQESDAGGNKIADKPDDILTPPEKGETGSEGGETWSGSNKLPQLNDFSSGISLSSGKISDREEEARRQMEVQKNLFSKNENYYSEKTAYHENLEKHYSGSLTRERSEKIESDEKWKGQIENLGQGQRKFKDTEDKEKGMKDFSETTDEIKKELKGKGVENKSPGEAAFWKFDKKKEDGEKVDFKKLDDMKNLAVPVSSGSFETEGPSSPSVQEGENTSGNKETGEKDKDKSAEDTKDKSDSEKTDSTKEDKAAGEKDIQTKEADEVKEEKGVKEKETEVAVDDLDSAIRDISSHTVKTSDNKDAGVSKDREDFYRDGENKIDPDEEEMNPLLKDLLHPKTPDITEKSILEKGSSGNIEKADSLIKHMAKHKDMHMLADFASYDMYLSSFKSSAGGLGGITRNKVKEKLMAYLYRDNSAKVR